MSRASRNETIFLTIKNRLNELYTVTGIKLSQIDLMHNDVTRLDAREECWSQQSSSGKIKQFKMATIQIFPTTKNSIPRGHQAL